MSSSSPILVEAAALHRRFNEARLYERVMDGEPREQLRAEHHLTRRQARRVGQRYCTFSQVLDYYDRAGYKLALVHQYLREHRLGGSGRPDPKWLRVGDETYALLPAPLFVGE